MCDVMTDDHEAERDDNVKKRKLDSMNHDTYAVVSVLDDVDVVNGLRRGRDSDDHVGRSSDHHSDHHVGGVEERESLNEEAIRLKSSIR